MRKKLIKIDLEKSSSVSNQKNIYWYSSKLKDAIQIFDEKFYNKKLKSHEIMNVNKLIKLYIEEKELFISEEDKLNIWWTNYSINYKYTKSIIKHINNQFTKIIPKKQRKVLISYLEAEDKETNELGITILKEKLKDYNLRNHNKSYLKKNFQHSDIKYKHK